MGGIADNLYGKLPVRLQNAAISAYGYWWHMRRFGGIFEQELRQCKDRETYSFEQWRSYQTARLRTLLVHAFETVPYYRRVYTAARFSASDFARFELEDLKQLPFLEKENLRAYGTSELLSRKPEPGGRFFKSSGSTGTPTKILFSNACHQRLSAAYEARVRHWAGLDRHMPRGMIGGRRVIPTAAARPPYYRYNVIEKQTYFSAYHISRNAAADYLDGMLRHRVEYMAGYAMSNYFLAVMFQDLSLDAPPLRAVAVSSEKLTPEMRDVFARVYSCRTYDGYSGVEACGLVSENEFGELMVSPDVGIMELLDDDGREVSAGETGEIVSTGLLNFDQPLIRYRIGDVAKRPVDQTSRSGRNMPLIEEIVGRIEDKIVGPDGREMVRFHGVFIDVPYLRSAQVVQEAVDRITVRAVTDADFSQAEERIITERIKSQLGEIDVSVVRVDELWRDASGKVRAVIATPSPS